QACLSRGGGYPAGYEPQWRIRRLSIALFVLPKVFIPFISSNKTHRKTTPKKESRLSYPPE
ncbi:MAG: hypothetical protein DYH02_14060, partial [Candidatus Omnitrophica bacterium COP1]|nr:hypothetical protein [Candidatus Omnitrophica bacterium COP1]